MHIIQAIRLIWTDWIKRVTSVYNLDLFSHDLIVEVAYISNLFRYSECLCFYVMLCMWGCVIRWFSLIVHISIPVTFSC